MFKRLLLISGVVSIGIFGILLYLWQQTTYVPDWYKTIEVSANTPADDKVAETPQTREQIWLRIFNSLQTQSANGESKGTVELNANEVNELIFTELVIKERVTSNTKLDKTILGTNTKFRDGKMVVGAMLNLQELTKHKEVSSGSRAEIAQTILNLPIVKDRPVYLEIEGTPTVRNRQIALDSPLVKLANVSLTVDDLSKYLGVSPAFLNQRIARERTLVPMEVENVKIEGDRMVVVGSATAW
jgi:hypothetical protein